MTSMPSDLVETPHTRKKDNRCLPSCCNSSSSSSSPLLSLVTSTSEISHQPVHTYIQYDKGVDRTGRQGIEEIYSIHKVREEKK